MSISGRLDDVSIAEVMQFIHLGKRSGVLYVEGAGKAEVHFNGGRIVAAHGERIHRLGELLVRNRIIDPHTLLQAIERQRAEPEHRVLGEVLLDMGAVSRDELSRALQVHIQDTIQEILGWRLGTFRFEIGEVRPIRGFERSLGQLLPSLNLNTQRVLLEAARLLDEARRQEERSEGDPDEARAPEAAPAEADGRTEPAESSVSADDLFSPPTEPAGPADGAARPNERPEAGMKRVHIVSGDDVFVSLLAARLDQESIWLDRHGPDAGLLGAGNGTRPLILIDASTQPSETAIEELLAHNPAAMPIAIVDPSAPEDYVATLGAVAIVERDVDSVVTRCLATLAGDQAPADAAGGSTTLLERLRRLSSEIRTGALAANATLVLLNTLAECSERSVLFAVRDGSLRAIGGFGFSTQTGRPIVEAIRGLTLALDDSHALAAAVSELETRELDFGVDRLPDDFTRLVGPPECGQAAVFPVSGTEKVILVVYADNGSRPLQQLELMTLAADQVGVAIENEFLRYRLAHA